MTVVINGTTGITSPGGDTGAADFNINGLTVGKGGGSATGNSAVGYQALNTNTSGTYNTAVGYQAGYSNTTGGVHAFGTAVLYANTTGLANAGFGGYDGASSIGSALRNNSTGSNNSAFGVGAMNQNTTGGLNVAVGTQALYSNTTANYNTAIGFNAIYANTTGTNLDAVGAYVLNKNTTGVANIAMGGSGTIPALYNNTTGSYNVGLGTGALFSNTTASLNTAVGYQALYSNTTGQENTVLGQAAGYAITTGSGNTYIGKSAGVAVTTGWGNVLIGDSTGASLTTGSGNTFVGSGDGRSVNPAGYLVTTGSNNTIIGAYNGNQGGLDIRTASNYIVLSDGSGNPRCIIDNGGNLIVGRTTSQGRISAERDNNDWCYNSNQTGTGTKNHFRFLDNGTVVGTITSSGSVTSYNVTSDRRLKENITDSLSGNIDEIQVRSFNYISDKSFVKYGFIAQELVEVAPYAVHQPSNSDEMMAVDYSKLVPMMVKEIQELRKRVALLESK